jgi:ribosomal protein S12 methylthiotransferase
MDELVNEAKKLAAQGVRELILIAQELTYYGLDIYRKRKLNELLQALSEVDGIVWIRLHYAYPAQFHVDLIDEMAANKKVCNYLDMPLQHANDNVLRAMRRNTTQEETRNLIKTIRQKNPGIAIRTTMLVGYPGETEEDFEDLKKFIEEMRFERLGVFQYSHEENTRAHDVEDDVPAEVKEERAAELMDIQEVISNEINQQKVDKIFDVLIDRKEGNYFIGRTEYDSPEVDNEVLIKANKKYLRIGDFAKVKITSAEAFDLYGESID